MALLTVGIGDCKVSKDVSDVLVTHALGSCIAVMLYDPVAKVAGLLHYMLPESSMDAQKAAARPFVFADTGIPLLLAQFTKLGASKARCITMAAGGAQMLDCCETFRIGQRNHQALRKIFWKAGIIVHKEEIGGTTSRTVRIDVASGRVQLKTPGKGDEDMVAKKSTPGARDGVQHTYSR